MSDLDNLRAMLQGAAIEHDVRPVPDSEREYISKIYRDPNDLRHERCATAVEFSGVVVGPIIFYFDGDGALVLPACLDE